MSERARVEVLDGLGRRVADLGDVDAEAAWPAGLPAGVYAVRATAGPATHVVRVSVLR